MLNDIGLTLEEVIDLYDVVTDEKELHKCQGLYSKLYSFFEPDMDYGTAKARTGDPYAFVEDKILSVVHEEVTNELGVIQLCDTSKNEFVTALAKVCGSIDTKPKKKAKIIVVIDNDSTGLSVLQIRIPLDVEAEFKIVDVTSPDYEYMLAKRASDGLIIYD